MTEDPDLRDPEVRRAVGAVMRDLRRIMDEVDAAETHALLEAVLFIQTDLKIDPSKLEAGGQ